MISSGWFNHQTKVGFGWSWLYLMETRWGRWQAQQVGTHVRVRNPWPACDQRMCFEVVWTIFMVYDFDYLNIYDMCLYICIFICLCLFLFSIIEQTKSIFGQSMCTYLYMYYVYLTMYIYIYMCIVARNSPVKADDPPVNHCLEISFLTRKWANPTTISTRRIIRHLQRSEGICGYLAKGVRQKLLFLSPLTLDQKCTKKHRHEDEICVQYNILRADVINVMIIIM